jgi:hypothetical protein
MARQRAASGEISMRKITDFIVPSECTIRLHEKGNQQRTIGLHFNAASAISEYIQKAGLASGPLFRARKSAKSDHLAERTSVERADSRLKDDFGDRTVRVRGAQKVFAHLMFGVLAITADQLLNSCRSCHTERGRRIGAAMTVSAHFDGKVIVPDEPLDLLPNQALILQIQTVEGQIAPAEDSALAWIAANAVDTEALPVDLADRHDHYLYGRPSKDELR